MVRADIEDYEQQMASENKYFDPDIVRQTDNLMTAIASHTKKRKKKNELAFPRGTSGQLQSFRPFECIGVKSQRDLTKWRQHEPHKMNDCHRNISVQIHSFLSDAIALDPDHPKIIGNYFDEDACLDMAIWVHENRLGGASELFRLYDRFFKAIERGLDFDSVKSSLRAKIESSVPKLKKQGHPFGTRVNRIEVSLCGSYIGECADDGKLNIYNGDIVSENGNYALNMIHEIDAGSDEDGSRARFYSFDFNSDGTLLATASTDKKAQIWNIDSDCAVTEFSHPDSVTDVSFSPDSKYLAVACDDFKVYIWSICGKALSATLNLHTNYVRSVRFSSDGRYLVSSGQDQVAIIWEIGGSISKISPRWAWGEHGGRVYDTAVLRKFNALATAGTDGYVRVYCIDTGRLLASSRHHDEWVNSICASNDEQLLLTTSTDKTARVWNWKSNDQLLCLRDARQPLRAARFSKDELTILTAGYEGSIAVWESK